MLRLELVRYCELLLLSWSERTTNMELTSAHLVEPDEEHGKGPTLNLR